MKLKSSRLKESMKCWIIEIVFYFRSSSIWKVSSSALFQVTLPVPNSFQLFLFPFHFHFHFKKLSSFPLTTKNFFLVIQFRFSFYWDWKWDKSLVVDQILSFFFFPFHWRLFEKERKLLAICFISPLLLSFKSTCVLSKNFPSFASFFYCKSCVVISRLLWPVSRKTSMISQIAQFYVTKNVLRK